MQLVSLLTKDGVTIEVQLDIIKCSSVINSTFERMGNAKKTIRLPDANSSIMEMIIEWATYHKNDPVVEDPVAKIDDMEEEIINISSWDAEFLKVNEKSLFELMMVANFLDIKPLIDVTCKTVGNMIMKKRMMKENRETFANVTDTPVEENKECKSDSPI